VRHQTQRTTHTNRHFATIQFRIGPHTAARPTHPRHHIRPAPSLAHVRRHQAPRRGAPRPRENVAPMADTLGSTWYSCVCRNVACVCTHIHMCIGTHAYLYEHTYMHTYIYICIGLYAYVYVCMHTCKHIAEAHNSSAFTVSTSTDETCRCRCGLGANRMNPRA